ncbi:MAG: PhnB protein [Clostridium chrysemydis]|uniref:PhnB protein n=1 Tax=Clostridium chrysemydis TaxID=2665504 RepID=UPI003F313E84
MGLGDYKKKNSLNNEINIILDKYRSKLKRKERIIKEYIEEKNSIDGFTSVKREIEYNVLYTEINMLKAFIEDLEE